MSTTKKMFEIGSSDRPRHFRANESVSKYIITGWRRRAGAHASLCLVCKYMRQGDIGEVNNLLCPDRTVSGWEMFMRCERRPLHES